MLIYDVTYTRTLAPQHTRRERFALKMSEANLRDIVLAQLGGDPPHFRIESAVLINKKNEENK